MKVFGPFHVPDLAAASKLMQRKSDPERDRQARARKLQWHVARSVGRMVGRVLAAAAYSGNDEPAPRWPLERDMPRGAVAIPAVEFSAEELVGGLLQMRGMIVGSTTRIASGAILPCIACDGKTVTLKLAEAAGGRPMVTLAGVPLAVVDLIVEG
jgi:hypothetical protein